VTPRVVIENRFGLRQIQGTIQDLGLNDTNQLPAQLEHDASGQVYKLAAVTPNYVLYRQVVETKGE